MTQAEVRDLIMPLTGGTSSCNITTAPEPSRRPLSFWKGAKPHTTVMPRDKQLIAAYFEIAARTGVTVRTDGIPLDGGGFLQPDKAVMNAGLEHKWLELREPEGVFTLTAAGWRGITSL